MAFLKTDSLCILRKPFHSDIFIKRTKGQRFLFLSQYILKQTVKLAFKWVMNFGTRQITINCYLSMISTQWVQHEGEGWERGWDWLTLSDYWYIYNCGDISYLILPFWLIRWNLKIQALGKTQDRWKKLVRQLCNFPSADFTFPF